jgi:hypothetical protein
MGRARVRARPSPTPHHVQVLCWHLVVLAELEKGIERREHHHRLLLDVAHAQRRAHDAGGHDDVAVIVEELVIGVDRLPSD